MNRPAAEPVDLVPSLATALTGVGALWLLVPDAAPADAPPPPGPCRRESAAPAAAGC